MIRIKVLGSSRLIVESPHLHGECNFTKLTVETV